MRFGAHFACAALRPTAWLGMRCTTAGTHAQTFRVAGASRARCVGLAERAPPQVRSFVDGSVPVEKTKAIKQGTLTKQGAKVRSWKKRHCVIFSGTPVCFEGVCVP